MRLLLIALLALLAAGCGAETEEPAASPAFAQLVVRVDADGRGAAPAKEVRLRCASAEESAACKAAGGLKPADFEPVPGDRACTQVFGGPEQATVEGELRGKPVDGAFSRHNGCEVSRWEAVAALLAQAK